MKYLSQNEANEIDEKLLKTFNSQRSLIEIAGLFAFDVITNIIEQKNKTILVLIGPGNNGGDGLVIAKWLMMTGHKVSVLVKKSKHDDLLEILVNLNVKVYNEMPNFEFDYVIDALFGINQRKEIEEPWLGIINSLKEHDRVIAVDVPSGCDIDSDEIGIYRPFCVVTFVAPKICCRNLKCFVTRSFVPKEIFYDEKYTNFCTYVEIT